jgi:hypothetical protein
MRHAAVVLVAWGALLGVLTAAQAPFGPRRIEFTMLGSASAACLLAGLVLWALDRRSEMSGAQARMVSDESLATATLIVGLALALLGAGFGLWLVLIGAGIVALGCGGLTREARARRRRREVRARRRPHGARAPRRRRNERAR